MLNRTRQIPKHYRPTLGRKLEEAIISLSMDIRSMLLTKKQDAALKQSQLSQTAKTVDDLKFLLHLGLDLKIFSPGAFGEMNEKLSSVGRQLGGMMKQSESE